MLFDKLDTAKMHAIDTSNVSCRDVTSQVEFGLHCLLPRLKQEFIVSGSNTANFVLKQLIVLQLIPLSGRLHYRSGIIFRHKRFVMA